MNDTVIGIDEAGRGPVLGPLVIGLIRWKQNQEPLNGDLRDSKKIESNERQQIAEQLRQRFDFRLLAIPAWVISKTHETITQLQTRCISQTLNEFPSSDVICDSLGNSKEATLWIQNEHPRRDISVEAKADENYKIVSAASIIAKVERDQALRNRTQYWGKLGSGYPSDPTTRKWLENWKQSDHEWPSFVRTNWNTLHRV